MHARALTPENLYPHLPLLHTLGNATKPPAHTSLCGYVLRCGG